MARAIIFIIGYEEKKKISDDCYYSYLNEEGRSILRVYNRNELVFECEAKIEDAFEVIGKNKGLYVTEMTPPRKRGEAIAWLLGFTKRDRASTCEEYKKLLNERYEKLPVIGYIEYRAMSLRFEYVKYSILTEIGNKRYNLACWVDEEITKKEILSLIPEFRYPKFYVKKVLWQKFGITGDEVEQALNSECYF